MRPCGQKSSALSAWTPYSHAMRVKITVFLEYTPECLFYDTVDLPLKKAGIEMRLHRIVSHIRYTRCINEVGMYSRKAFIQGNI